MPFWFLEFCFSSSLPLTFQPHFPSPNPSSWCISSPKMTIINWHLRHYDQRCLMASLTNELQSLIAGPEMTPKTNFGPVAPFAREDRCWSMCAAFIFTPHTSPLDCCNPQALKIFWSEVPELPTSDLVMGWVPKCWGQLCKIEEVGLENVFCNIFLVCP